MGAKGVESTVALFLSGGPYAPLLQGSPKKKKKKEDAVNEGVSEHLPVRSSTQPATRCFFFFIIFLFPSTFQLSTNTSGS